VTGFRQPVDQPAVGAFDRNWQPCWSTEPAQAGNEVVEPGGRVGMRKVRTVLPVWSSTQTACSVDAQSIPTNMSTTSWKLTGHLGEEDSAGWSLTGARGACLYCRLQALGRLERGGVLLALEGRPTLAVAPALTEPYNKDLRQPSSKQGGPVTYDDHAGAWPEREAAGGEDAEFAKVLGDARKIVVSRQRLEEFTWRNSEQLQGDLVEAVTALKNQPGDRHIAMSGSVSVVRQLLTAGLLDELRLLVHPIAVRKGMRLFDEGESPIPLRLISSEAFSTGVLNLVYGPAESMGDATYEDAKVHLSQPEH
jgi:dihydrofolate reductase